MHEIAPGRRSFDRDLGTELIGEVFLAVLALERAYNWARWLSVNCEPAMEALTNTFEDSPLRDGELDLMWRGIHARRSAIQHMESRAESDPDGYFAFREGRLEISGLPPMSFAGERLWAGLLSNWSERFLNPPVTARDSEPSERPREIDLAGLPGWLK